MNEEKQYTANGTNEAATTTESTSSASAATAASSTQSGSSRKLALALGAVAAVVILFLGILYVMEKEGRSETNVFGSLIESQESSRTVAVVNGTEITNADLATGVEQFSQAATAQGMDTSTAEAQSQIRSQALEVIVNTELLKQAAAEAGLSVSDEQVEERMNSITEDIGGEEVLAERIEALGLTMSELREDIRDEILIEQYIESLLGEEEIGATEEEIATFYAEAGGEEAGLPPLEEVRGQIEQQIVASQEQVIIDDVINELRADASIETME